MHTDESRRAEAGLEFVKIWDTAESAILEFKIATDAVT
jgi:hypothetical protein